MHISIYGITDKGAVLESNEDRILIDGRVYREGETAALVTEPTLAAVCDGVGGETGGEMAAEFCLSELAKVRYSSLTDLKSVIIDIHNKLLEAASFDERYRNMQTTLCAFALDEKCNCCCVNVGDSRLYRYAGGVATQLSTDHTLVRYLYDMGEMTAEEMKTSPDRNVIISSVGGDEQIPRIDVFTIGEKFGTLPDDTIIICSDGITDHVGRTEIEVCMGLDVPFEDKIDAIYRLALSRGSCDNLSVIGIAGEA